MKLGFLSSLLVLGALLSACQSENGQMGHPNVPVSPGQRLFLTNCVSCHTGAGDPPGPNAMVLDSEKLKSEVAFKALLRQPVSPMMRAFNAEEISDADVHQLYNYLQSAKTPKAP